MRAGGSLLEHPAAYRAGCGERVALRRTLALTCRAMAFRPAPFLVADLGRVAHGFARATRLRGQLLGGCPHSQSVKSAVKEAVKRPSGLRRRQGCKIHALVNSEGLPMRVVVHSGAIQDRDGAGLAFDKIRKALPFAQTDLG